MFNASWESLTGSLDGQIVGRVFEELTGTEDADPQMPAFLAKCTPQSGLGVILLLARLILGIDIPKGPTPNLVPARNPDNP